MSWATSKEVSLAKFENNKINENKFVIEEKKKLEISIEFFEKAI